MYRRLDPRWAGTLLGLVQVAIIPIPVVFYRYGGRIRRRSALIGRMQVEKERLEGRRRKRVEGAVEVVAEAGVAEVEGREKELEV